MNKLIADFETYNRVKNLSGYTVAWYSRKLRDFAQWLDGDDLLHVPHQRLRQYISEKMVRGLRPATVKGYFAALSAFYAFLVEEDVIEEAQNPMKRLKPPKVPNEQVEPLTGEQVHRLLLAFNSKKERERRNYTMCLLMLDTGLRISEVAGLQVNDIDFKQRRLKIMGKGQKQRWVYIGERMEEILGGYISSCRPSLANGNDILFPGRNGQSFDAENISKIIMRHMDKVGIPRVRSSAHRLRHTFAVSFLRAGGDVFSLQRLLGHSTLEMTRRYVRLADDDLAEAHRKASPVDRMAL